MKRGIILAIGGFSFLLAGCGPQKSAESIQIKPKWQGEPYHIAFDSKNTKPSKAAITIPDVTYNANPDMLENRACLVVRFDSSAVKTDQTVMNQVVMGPVDIHGTQGALPADYMEATDEGLAHLLEAYKVKGKVKVSVLLAQSSIPSQAGPSDIAENQLSDWLSTDIDVKSPGRVH